MQPGERDDELVIPTPERVAFQYPIAGIGSRFLAQAIDLFVFSALFAVIAIAGLAFGAVFRIAQLAILIWLILSFILTFGYFLVSEAVFGGQTVGKRALRLRVVGDHGEPILFTQAAIRNLVRIVDFLPFFYGIGLVALFINGRGKRLGDLAAGTLVVRERERVSLYDLAAASAPAAPSPPPTPVASIWATPTTAPREAAPASATGASPHERLGRLDPALRRLVVAYAGRRATLPRDRREGLARSAAPALQRALPDLVAQSGPLAALDQLAEWEGVTPARTMARGATAALSLGILSLCADVLLILSPLGVIFGITAIVVAQRTIRQVKAHPESTTGDDRARLGRVFAIVGTGLGSLLIAGYLVGTFIVR